MRKGIFAFIMMFAANFVFAYLTLNTWGTAWAIIFGFIAFGCIFATFQVAYLAAKNREWPEVKGGPSISWGGTPTKKR